MEALRNLKPELQDKIMEEGPIKEGDGNPIIVLMKRIKEVAEWAQQEADREEKRPQAPETTPEEEVKAPAPTPPAQPAPPAPPAAPAAPPAPPSGAEENGEDAMPEADQAMLLRVSWLEHLKHELRPLLGKFS